MNVPNLVRGFGLIGTAYILYQMLFPVVSDAFLWVLLLVSVVAVLGGAAYVFVATAPPKSQPSAVRSRTGNRHGRG